MAGAHVPSGMHAHSTLTKSYGYTQYRMWYVFQMFVLLPLSVRKFSLSIWKWLLHCLLGYMWIYYRCGRSHFQPIYIASIENWNLLFNFITRLIRLTMHNARTTVISSHTNTTVAKKKRSHFEDVQNREKKAIAFGFLCVSVCIRLSSASLMWCFWLWPKLRPQCNDTPNAKQRQIHKFQPFSTAKKKQMTIKKDCCRNQQKRGDNKHTYKVFPPLYFFFLRCRCCC